jgi:hypothetical protein
MLEFVRLRLLALKRRAFGGWLRHQQELRAQRLLSGRPAWRPPGPRSASGLLPARTAVVADKRATVCAAVPDFSAAVGPSAQLPAAFAAPPDFSGLMAAPPPAFPSVEQLQAQQLIQQSDQRKLTELAQWVLSGDLPAAAPQPLSAQPPTARQPPQPQPQQPQRFVRPCKAAAPAPAAAAYRAPGLPEQAALAHEMQLLTNFASAKPPSMISEGKRGGLSADVAAPAPAAQAAAVPASGGIPHWLHAAARAELSQQLQSPPQVLQQQPGPGSGGAGGVPSFVDPALAPYASLQRAFDPRVAGNLSATATRAGAGNSVAKAS